MNQNRRFVLLIGLLALLFTPVAHAAFSPQSDPPATMPYSPTAPSWKVSSAYGPRYVTTGSTLHKGIDFNQQTGSNDEGVILTAREGGVINKINTVGMKYISILSPSGTLDYFHIFNDQALPITVTNANVTAAGWSKVVLTNIVNTTATGQCGSIFFYALVNGMEILQKVLTEPACVGGVRGFRSWAGRTGRGGVPISSIIYPQATVATNEAIAPMGTSGGFAAHLHQQLNSGADNVLSVMNVSQGLIAGTNRFAFSLDQPAFTSDSVKAMTNGPGVALKVTENSLVPVLDKLEVKVPLVDGSWKTTLFSFGGKAGVGEEGNVTDDMVQSGFNLVTGSTAKTIKPVGWNESGTAREMWFFVPHQAVDFSGLKAGTTYTLKVTATTVYGASYPADIAFTYTPGCDVPVVYGGKEWQRCGSQTMMDWNQANSYCANLTDGGYDDWFLPGIVTLQSLIVCTNGTQVKKISVNAYGEALDITVRFPTHCADGNNAPYVSPTILTQGPAYFSSFSTFYWASTYADYYHRSAWFVNFNNGYANDYSILGSSGYVRCVRGGSGF